MKKKTVLMFAAAAVFSLLGLIAKPVAPTSEAHTLQTDTLLAVCETTIIGRGSTGGGNTGGGGSIWFPSPTPCPKPPKEPIFV
ncbi:hypothetical protein [Deinococcus roseus]|uniref:Secreted protein n=1 Tax=Deinococcus roseus TaxID=392414 RepID=A0ABQ2DA40_9DEIO|nr:hypothetical protein [Deinococcus roseus]GGJ49045.1 hypothetical protein GCM10008938_38820 [Deinococcus roseus]